ncbi:MAG: CRISPR-associated protein Cas5 [Oscillospiraceae bacterium]
MTNILNCPQVTITVWGDFALFSRPEGKVERITYPVPTPVRSGGCWRRFIPSRRSSTGRCNGLRF